MYTSVFSARYAYDVWRDSLDWFVWKSIWIHHIVRARVEEFQVSSPSPDPSRSHAVNQFASHR